MFTTKEIKKQTRDLGQSSKKKSSWQEVEDTRQPAILPESTNLLQRYFGNSCLQSMYEARQNTLLGGVLTSQYATTQAKINKTTSPNIKSEIEEPLVEETPVETETEVAPAVETPPEVEREETEETPVEETIIEPVRIVRDKDLWWFDGENAANYDENVKLTAWGGRPGATRGTFRWDVARGAGIIDFQNNSDSMTRVNANRIGIQSTDASATRGDVKVRCRWSHGSASKTLFHSFTVLAPEDGVVVSSPPPDTAILNGFLTQYVIEVRDQFGTRLPEEVEVNEAFGAWASDFAGETWPTPAEVSNMTGTPALAQVTDTYLARAPAGTWIPDPVNPGHADAGVRVQHAEQVYRAGSLTAGDGREIKRHTLQFYRGRARQE